MSPISQPSQSSDTQKLRNRTTQTWTVVCRTIVIVAVSLFVALSILTYYDGLSQYFTQDQELTLGRINRFLEGHYPQIATGSNLSGIVVGLPAERLRGWLDAHFKPGDHLIGNIYYTTLLPFSFVQVTIALFLLVACVFLLGKLSDWRLKQDYLYYLLCLAVLLNFPMLKGLCKVLKYDCLSIVLAALAFLSYLVAKKRASVCYFLLAILLSGLAYIEKDTAISLLFFMVLSECVLFYFGKDLSLRRGLIVLGSILTIVAGFLLTIFATVPELWRHPGELGVPFSFIPGYGVPSNPKFLPPVAVALILLFFGRKYVALVLVKIRHYFPPKVVFVLLAALCVFALAYQRNDLKWTQSDAVKAQFRSQGLYVGNTIAGVALTTLDKGALLTRIKYLLAEVRLIIYFLPEALVLMLVLSPAVIGKIKWTLDRRAIVMIAAFCGFHLLAYAYLLAPVEAKYLAFVMFALVMLSASFLSGITKELVAKNVFAGSLAAVTIVVSLIVPAFQNAPAYFGYMNVFRSRSAEDIASISVDDYSFWTWVGWGETSYRLVSFASQNASGKNITVGFDYGPPFYTPANVRMTDTQGTRGVTDLAQMNEYLKKLVEEKVDYFIISKNTANRDPGSNQFLRQTRDKAVYVDRQGGIEYGWLFRPSDVLNK